MQNSTISEKENLTISGKIKYAFTFWYSNPLLGIHSKGYTDKNTKTHMHKASVTAADSGEQQLQKRLSYLVYAPV